MKRIRATLDWIEESIATVERSKGLNESAKPANAEEEDDR
jgi:hypothetical protein